MLTFRVFLLLALVASPERPPPLSPEEALEAFRTDPPLRVDLAVSEPLVVDPVAIDFGLDGRLWVVEMRDYPTGMEGSWEPGGRVRLLDDTDGDGVVDRAVTFLDGLPFPTGVLAWRDGALVCAAPDIIFARDTDGDGHADERTTLFTGFATENYQARVNSLRFGLDNWVYGANGLLGGRVRSLATGRVVDLGKRDFRMRPDSGEFEPVAGLTQHGRARDDWGEWFGNENWALLRHYPLPDRYVARNPHAAPPPPRVDVPAGENPNRLYPASRTLERFNDPHMANRTTSACGSAIYRDELLGDDFRRNAFVCEPVHNLVRRMALEERGVTFAGHQRPEAGSEFLASTDNWFRPVEVRTGPDGALWVVDMYRFVIEHPRWIPPDRLEHLDVRAGSDRGRIYRILPFDGAARPIEDLSGRPAVALARLLDHPSGPVRDAVHRTLVHRSDLSAAPVLEEVARESSRAESRLQALCALEGIGALAGSHLETALEDDHPAVRRHAVRLAEPFLGSTRRLSGRVLARVSDPSLLVRYQLALSLGEWPARPAGRALGSLAGRDAHDPWLRAAVLSSAVPHAGVVLPAVLQSGDDPAETTLVARLVSTGVGSGDLRHLRGALRALCPLPGGEIEPSRLVHCSTVSPRAKAESRPSRARLGMRPASSRLPSARSSRGRAMSSGIPNAATSTRRPWRSSAATLEDEMRTPRSPPVASDRHSRPPCTGRPSRLSRGSARSRRRGSSRRVFARALLPAVEKPSRRSSAVLRGTAFSFRLSKRETFVRPRSTLP